MSISVKIATLAIAAVVLSTSFASAAQVSNRLPTKTIGTVVSLGCSAGHGDVAQTITITNTSGAAIAKGTKISWTLYTAKGSQVLDAVLAVGGTISDLAPPGNGGTCKATFLR